MSLSENFQSAENYYKLSYPHLKSNGKYLMNYGSELIINGEYNKGIKVLEKGKVLFPHSTVFMHLGDAYIANNNYSKAEENYLIAENINPKKFIPKFKLLELYIARHDSAKVNFYSKKITSFPVKINSSIVSEIKINCGFSSKKI